MCKGRPTIEKIEHNDGHDYRYTCDGHDRSQIYPWKNSNILIDTVVLKIMFIIIEAHDFWYISCNKVIPISGIDSDVSGIFSAIANMKTENASKTVTPRAIFSPESGGKQNTSTVNVLIIIQGKTILYL